MSANAYEILALAMRYIFAGLMLLIVLRALFVTMVDGRRAAELRRLNPKTGIIGEFLVLEDVRFGRERRYPVTLEGCIGASSRADIRIRRSGLRARHAYYQMTPSGLYVRGHANITLRDEDGSYVRERILVDGDILYIGRLELMLILTEGSAMPSFHVRKPVQHESEDDIFETDDEDFSPNQPDDYFSANPAAGRSRFDAFDDDFDVYDDDFDEYDDF